ncbi:MAG: hypothetical protein JWN34_5050 [Bryobacterales bacterium]|nr:hypothetical protein [Bryobacterales bacterium]
MYMSFTNAKVLAALVLTLASVASAAPRLGLSATTVGPVNTQPGQAGPTQTVQAYNLGDGSLTLSATASASWLSATVGAKADCPQAGGGCYAISIALNTASVAAGTYTEFVTVSDPNAVDAPQDIKVTVNTTGVQSSITAYVTPTGSVGSTSVFQVFTTGTGVKGTVSTTSGGNWLTFLSGSGGIVKNDAPWLIQVAAQAGQATGTYTGTVVITGSSVPAENKTINVTMNVTSAPIIQLNNSSTVRLSTFVGGATQYSVVTFNNIGAGSLSITSATGSQPFLKGTVNGNSVLIAADPAGLAQGIYNGAITLASNAANNAQVSVPVQLVVGPRGQPLILSGGVVNAANGAAEAVSAGDIVAIYGSQLAADGTAATNSSTPLAKTLGGVQVLIGGVAAPLYFVSPGQINFQIPYTVTSGTTVQVVSNGQRGNIRTLDVNGAMPRLLYFVSFISGNYGVIVNSSDSSLTLPTGTVVPGFATHPAKPGDTIIVYGIGFGTTSPVAVEGQAASSSPLQRIAGATATFGGGFSGRPTTVNSEFTGLTPTAVGLYQANVKIPDDTPLGPAVPLALLVNGVQTNNVYLAISATGR